MAHTSNQPHITSYKVYFLVFAALLTLTIITVGVSVIDLGAKWNMVVAMVVATTKAVLVGLFFMHLLHDNKLYMTVFSMAFVFLGIFIILTLFDTMRRADVDPIVAHPIRAQAEFYQHLEADSTLMHEGTSVQEGH